MIDNGSCYRSFTFRKACKRTGQRTIRGGVLNKLNVNGAGSSSAEINLHRVVSKDFCRQVFCRCKRNSSCLGWQTGVVDIVDEYDKCAPCILRGPDGPANQP